MLGLCVRFSSSVNAIYYTVECCQHGRKKSSHNVAKLLKKSHFTTFIFELPHWSKISKFLRFRKKINRETLFGDFSTVWKVVLHTGNTSFKTTLAPLVIKWFRNDHSRDLISHHALWSEISFTTTYRIEGGFDGSDDSSLNYIVMMAVLQKLFPFPGFFCNFLSYFNKSPFTERMLKKICQHNEKWNVWIFVPKSRKLLNFTEKTLLKYFNWK